MVIEFSVDIVTGPADAPIVKGRCLKGPIKLGDVFSSTYTFDDRRSETPTRVGEFSVSLRVQKMMAYRRYLDEIDEGLTAQLELVGTGGTEVKSGGILGTSR
ncbi:MAG: hypothetical protein ABI193_17250 [Minicystis sp.]